MFPEGSKVGRYSIELPREAVDAILSLAAEEFEAMRTPHKPYLTPTSLALEVWYKDAVYGVSVKRDGSAASVEFYWGNNQLSVRNGDATAEQLEALKARWVRKLSL